MAINVFMSWLCKVENHIKSHDAQSVNFIESDKSYHWYCIIV